MTIIDALLGCSMMFEAAPIRVLNKSLADIGLDPTATYSPTTDQENVDLAAIYSLIALKSTDSIGQGDFNTKFNQAQADKTITFLYNKNGGFGGNAALDALLADIYGTDPQVSNVSWLW